MTLQDARVHLRPGGQDAQNTLFYRMLVWSENKISHEQCGSKVLYVVTVHCLKIYIYIFSCHILSINNINCIKEHPKHFNDTFPTSKAALYLIEDATKPQKHGLNWLHIYALSHTHTHTHTQASKLYMTLPLNFSFRCWFHSSTHYSCTEGVWKLLVVFFFLL